MKTTTIRDLLGAEALFADLEPDDLDLLSGCGRNERFEAGALLAREDDPAERFFVVRHGRVALELHAPGGSLVVDTAGPGDVLGWSWLFPPYRWTADLRAVDLSRVIAIDGRCLRDKCDADPAFGYRMVTRFARILTHRLAAVHLQLLDMYGLDRVR